jgi:hypothetical protein
MLGAKRLLSDCQGALKERPRVSEVALVLEQVAEVVEASRSIGMLGGAVAGVVGIWVA